MGRTEQQQIRDAMESGLKNGGTGLLKDGAGQTDEQRKKNHFILKSKGFYDLQAYIFVGLTLPGDTTTFETQIPRDTVKDLNDIDSDVYGDTRDALVETHKQCDAFNKESLVKWSTVTNKVIFYAEYFQTKVDGKLGLKAALGVLADESAENKPDLKPFNYKGAKALAAKHFKDLTAQAIEVQKECDSIKDRAKSFQIEVAATKSKIDRLDVLYNKGPVTDKSGNVKLKDGKPVEPYAKQLSAKKDEQRRIMREKTNGYNSAYDEWKHDTIVAATSPTYAWLFPAGTISAVFVATKYGIEATQARDRYESLKKEAEAAGNNVKNLDTIIDLVNHMDQQLSFIDKLQGNAITALEEIGKIFGVLAIKLDLIRASLVDSESSSREDLALVRQSALASLQVAEENWKLVKAAAEEFRDTSGIQVQTYDPNKKFNIDINDTEEQVMKKVNGAVAGVTNSQNAAAVNKILTQLSQDPHASQHASIIADHKEEIKNFGSSIGISVH